MKVIVDLCVVPIGVGVHLAPYIAACEKVLTEAGLKVQLHPNGAAIDGEWEPEFAAIEACHQAVHAMGCPRFHTHVRASTRTDKDQTLKDKVANSRQRNAPPGCSALAGPSLRVCGKTRK